MAIQYKGDRAVVVDLYLHVSSKLSSGNFQSSSPQHVEKPFVERYRNFRAGSVYERRAPPFHHIPVECELGYHQHGSARFLQPKVHLALAVVEQSETGDLLGHPIYLRRHVAMGEPDQQAKASSDRAGHPVVDPDRRLGNPLEDYSHSRGSYQNGLASLESRQSRVVAQQAVRLRG